MKHLYDFGCYSFMLTLQSRIGAAVIADVVKLIIPKIIRLCNQKMLNMGLWNLFSMPQIYKAVF